MYSKERARENVAYLKLWWGSTVLDDITEIRHKIQVGWLLRDPNHTKVPTLNGHNISQNDFVIIIIIFI